MLHSYDRYLLLCGRITIELYYIYFNSAESIPINPLPQVSLISTVEPSIQYTPINRTYAIHPHFHPLKSNNQDTSRGAWIRGVPLYLTVCLIHLCIFITTLHLQPENVALIKVTLIGESPDTFDGSQFAASVQRLFSELELNSPRVSMYAVFVEDGNTM